MLPLAIIPILDKLKDANTKLSFAHELGGSTFRLQGGEDGIVFNFVISTIFSNTPILAQTNRFVGDPFIKAELDKPSIIIPTNKKDQIAQNKGRSTSRIRLRILYAALNGNTINNK